MGEPNVKTYESMTSGLEAELAAARGALARDVAAAIAPRDWQDFLRDRFDVAALVAHIDRLRRDQKFADAMRADADRAREAQGRGRGRPSKKSSHETSPSKPAAAHAIKDEAGKSRTAKGQTGKDQAAKDRATKDRATKDESAAAL